MSNLLNKLSDKLSGDHNDQQESEHQKRQQERAGMSQRSNQSAGVASDDYNSGYSSAQQPSSFDSSNNQHQQEPSSTLSGNQQWGSSGTRGSKMAGGRDEDDADTEDYGDFTSGARQTRSKTQQREQPDVVETSEDAFRNQRGPFDDDNMGLGNDQFGKTSMGQGNNNQQQQQEPLQPGQTRYVKKTQDIYRSGPIPKGSNKGNDYMNDDM